MKSSIDELTFLYTMGIKDFASVICAHCKEMKPSIKSDMEHF